MIQILQQALTILTTPPGNLVYHMVVAFLIAVTLPVALVPLRNRGLPEARRMITGLFLLFLGWIVLFVSTILEGQDLDLPVVLFPILDRAFTAFSLAIIIWLWAFPEALRLADAGTILIGLLVVIVTAFTLIWSSNQEIGPSFNGSFPDKLWEGLSLVLLLLGGLALLARRPIGWGVGFIMLVVLLSGHLSELLVPLQDSDYPGAVRITQLIAYPLLLFLPQRFTVAAPLAQPASQSQTLIPERRRYNIGPKAFRSFLSLAIETDAQQICQAIVRAVSEALLADICLLVSPPDDSGDMSIECGYDLIREEFREGGYLSSEHVPMLAAALRRGRALRLPATSVSEDLNGLSQALNISRSGSLLAVPIISSAERVIAGVVLLSPYSNRSWTPEDQNYLWATSKTLGQIITDSTRTAPSTEGPSVDYQGLLEQIESLKKQLIEEQERTEFLAAIVAAQDVSQGAFPEAEAGGAPMPGALEGEQSGQVAASEEVEQVQDELRLALEELAYLRNDLAKADEKIAQLEKASPQTGLPGENDEVVTSLAQELRQPMSSIIGYTDLLLSESAGILGALQRKFLERIRVSTERIGALVEDLVQVTTLDSGTMELTPEPVDLNQLIQEATIQIGSQIQAKDIDMQCDIPQDLPQIHADRDALQQAIIHLLQNAAAVTPEGGQVSFLVRVEGADDKQDYILMQVADQGGGIPPEDLPRVFSRLYRADNVLIQGVGDTGVGLSIVKQLIEAHGGRVWVDTDLGQGSIFSVLIPVDDDPILSARDGDGIGELAA
jgi:signal transduction histidine kinase